jgi:L-2-hydroxyglutarate oxidase LhgO
MASPSPSAAVSVEAVVIGAGVIGLAVARALTTLAGKTEVLILDRASQIGAETSSRNSEVVHAGLYYPHNSLKARFCVKGRHQLYDFCDKRSIPYNRCGKLVVATDREQMQVILPSLLKQALENGVDDVKLMNQEDIKVLEPSLSDSLRGALWSPSTGIVDSHGFMLGLLADAEQNGATLALYTDVEDAKVDLDENNKRRINICTDGTWLSCQTLVNCAGLWADRFASYLHRRTEESSEVGDLSVWQPPKQFFAKGTYFRLQGQSASFSHLIYPTPENGGLGVHATIDLTGQVRFGPDVEWLDPTATEPGAIDMAPDPNRATSFYESIRRYWPQLKDGALVPDYTGVRPKLYHPSLRLDSASSIPFHDFSIVGPDIHGIPGLVHLFGIESPGLTSSMAIAEYVAGMVMDRM